MSAEEAGLTEMRLTAERRYPIPAPVDHLTNADYMVRVVFVQGQRSGWIDHAEWRASRGVTDELLEDLHAQYHDVPGNLYGRDDCGWERCEFWDAAKFALEAAGKVRP